MTVEELHPTSFRFTEDELGLLDELAQAIRDRHNGRLVISRRTAVMVAVDIATDYYRNGKDSALANPA
jgi:hypothetical protein